MSNRLRWVLAIASIPIALGLSYLLATAGEPRSAWIWCSVLHLCGN